MRKLAESSMIQIIKNSDSKLCNNVCRYYVYLNDIFGSENVTKSDSSEWCTILATRTFLLASRVYTARYGGSYEGLTKPPNVLIPAFQSFFQKTPKSLRIKGQGYDLLAFQEKYSPIVLSLSLSLSLTK